MLRLIQEYCPTLPAQGMAMEEALFETASNDGLDTIRFWINNRCVIIGRSQAAWSEVDRDRAEALGIPVIRRLSGGGAVYHYPGNLNISLFLSEGASLGTVDESFRAFGGALAGSLSTLGLQILSDRGSLLRGERKIGGAAQMRRGNCLLYHTTLLVEPDSLDMKDLLLAMRPGYAPSATRSLPVETATLREIRCFDLPKPSSIAQLMLQGISAVLHRPIREGKPSFQEEEKAERLASQKYSDPQWNLYR